MVGLQSLDLPIGVRIPVSSQYQTGDRRRETRDFGSRSGLLSHRFYGRLARNQIRVRTPRQTNGYSSSLELSYWFEAGRSDLACPRLSYKEMEENDNACWLSPRVMSDINHPPLRRFLWSAPCCRDRAGHPVHYEIVRPADSALWPKRDDAL